MEIKNKNLYFPKNFEQLFLEKFSIFRGRYLVHLEDFLSGSWYWYLVVMRVPLRVGHFLRDLAFKYGLVLRTILCYTVPLLV